jgi:hypothetical protein
VLVHLLLKLFLPWMTLMFPRRQLAALELHLQKLLNLCRVRLQRSHVLPRAQCLALWLLKLML